MPKRSISFSYSSSNFAEVANDRSDGQRQTDDKVKDLDESVVVENKKAELATLNSSQET